MAQPFDLTEEYGNSETNPLDILAQAAAQRRTADSAPAGGDDAEAAAAAMEQLSQQEQQSQAEQSLMIPANVVTEIRTLASDKKYSEIGELIASII